MARASEGKADSFRMSTAAPLPLREAAMRSFQLAMHGGGVWGGAVASSNAHGQPRTHVSLATGTASSSVFFLGAFRALQKAFLHAQSTIVAIKSAPPGTSQLRARTLLPRPRCQRAVLSSHQTLRRPYQQHEQQTWSPVSHAVSLGEHPPIHYSQRYLLTDWRWFVLQMPTGQAPLEPGLAAAHCNGGKSQT